MTRTILFAVLFQLIAAIGMTQEPAAPVETTQAAEASPSAPKAPAETNPQARATEAKVFTLKGCTATDVAQLLRHLNPSPSFQAFGNNQALRLVVVGTPEELASAEQTVNRLQELITQITEGDNKLYELLKSLGTEHPGVLKLNAELEALDAEIVKLEAGLKHYVPPKRIEEFKTPPLSATVETESAEEPSPNATSDFQLGVVLHRTKPAEAARILKLVINDDRLTAEPEGDNIVRVKYRSATKAEVEAMASVLEQMEKPERTTPATQSDSSTTPTAAPQSVPPGPLVDYMCKHRSAEDARRLICILFPSLQPAQLVADTTGNRLLYSGTDHQTAKDLERILLDWDHPTDGAHAERVRLQVQELRSQLAGQKNQTSEPTTVKSLEMRIAALEDALKHDGVENLVQAKITSPSDSDTTPFAEPQSVLPNMLRTCARLRVTTNGKESKASGTIIESGSETIVLTCSHLFWGMTDQTRIEVELFDSHRPRTYVAKLLGHSPEADVALIQFDTSREKHGSAGIAPLSLIPSVGNEVISIGCIRGESPTSSTRKIVHVNQFKGADNLTCTGQPEVGEAGGGLFNDQGQLIGVCTAAAAAAKQGVYCGLGPIHELIKRHEPARLDDNLSATLPTSPSGSGEPEGASSVKVFALQHARATEVAEVLKQVYDRGPSKIVPDPRTNSVIVTGPDAQVQEIEALLRKLDDAGNSPASAVRRVRTYRVKNGDTLSSIASKELGDSRFSKALFDVNRNLLKTPDSLRSGMELVVPIPTDPIEAEATKLVVQLQDELTKLLQTLGPNHPMVKELQARLAASREAVNQQEQATPGSLGFTALLKQYQAVIEEIQLLEERLTRMERSGDAYSVGNINDSRLSLKQAEAKLAEIESRIAAPNNQLKARLLRVMVNSLCQWQKTPGLHKDKVTEVEALIPGIIAQLDESPEAAQKAALELADRLDGESFASIENAMTLARKNQAKQIQEMKLRGEKQPIDDTEVGRQEDRLAVLRRTQEARRLAADITLQVAIVSPEEAAAWSSMVNEVIQELQKERDSVIAKNLGKHSPRVDDLDAAIAQIKAANADVFATAANEQAKTIAGLKEVVSMMPATLAAARTERDQLLKADPTNPRIRELDQSIATVIVMSRNYAKAIAAAESGVLPTATSTFTTTPPSGNIPLSITISMNESSLKELQQQLTQLRKDYEAADAQAHQLAVQLQQSPNEAKKAELSKAVQRAFTTRQSLLRAELMEMQIRLLQTQRSIDLRERISDQIIQRRVEDLLNPQLKWEGTPADSTPGSASQQAKSPSASIPKGLRVFTFTANDTHTHKGILRPGDKVDVSVTFADRKRNMVTKVLLEHIEVFAIENRTSDSEDGKNEQRARNVSLLVTPEQVNFAKVAQSKGQLSLSLRHPDDDEVANTNGINSALMDELQRAQSMDEEPQAALLAKMQGTWVLDGKMEDGSRILVEIRDNVMTWSVDTPLEPGDGKPPIFLIKLGETEKPQSVDLTMNPNDGPERKELLGIVEIGDDQVRFCVNMDDIGLRPELFANGKAAELWTLRRPAKPSPAYLGVQLAPDPVGPVELNDTKFRGGLRIEKVYAGTPAAEGGLLAGDILVGLGAWEVAKLEDLQYALGLSQKGEVSFHVLRDGHVRKGYVLLDGSKRPDTDAKLPPDQLTKIPVEVQRGHSTPVSQPDPKAAILAKLQGTWDVDLSGADGVDDPPQINVWSRGHHSWAVTELEGDWHCISITDPTGKPLDHPKKNVSVRGDKWYSLPEHAPSNIQIHIEPGQKTIDFEKSITYAYWFHRNNLKLSGNRMVMEFARGHDAALEGAPMLEGNWTELDGDWHLVAYYDHEGKPQEMLPSNRSFRGDQSSFVGPGHRHDCRIKVDPIKKTLWSYSKEEDGSFGQDYYELKGHQLILRNEPGALGYQVFERGHVRIPSVVPPATEEQKLLWRSAIVEIVTYGDSHVNNGGENVVARGVVVSPGGLILAHLAGRWDPPLKDRKVMAKFDDGSRIPLTVVEEGDGFIAFQPEKPINANHYFKVSQTVVQPHDEVRIWGPDHSRPGNDVTLFPFANTVTVLDRKYPALGIAVWQLRIGYDPVLGTPILDAQGDLLGVTITGTRDLLLAVPVAQLKKLFPKSLGQPPAAAAPVPKSRSAEEIAERLKALQGTWTVDDFDSPDKEKSPTPLEIHISGNQMTMVGQSTDQDGKVVAKNEIVQIDLTDGADERAIDLFADHLRGREPRVTVHGIYEVDGNTLAFCLSEDGPRPTEFGADAKTQTTCLRCVRQGIEKPEPPTETIPAQP